MTAITPTIEKAIADIRSSFPNCKDSLSALTAWLGLSADRFMGHRRMAFGAASPLTQISNLLRDDPNLNSEAATALDELIKSTYARLRSHTKD